MYVKKSEVYLPIPNHQSPRSPNHSLVNQTKNRKNKKQKKKKKETTHAVGVSLRSSQDPGGKQLLLLLLLLSILAPLKFPSLHFTSLHFTDQRERAVLCANQKNAAAPFITPLHIPLFLQQLPLFFFFFP